MSLSAAHESKQIQRTCQGCGDRRARFRYRGVVKADRDHTLCFECYRSERERTRARLLAATSRDTWLFPIRRSNGVGTPLSPARSTIAS